MKRQLSLLGALLSLTLPTLAQAAEVNVYSGRHYDTDRRAFEMFTEKTGIEVNLIEGADDALTQRIKAEGAASPADVLITVDAGRLWRAENDGLFQSTQSDVLNQNIPASLRHPEGLWFGLSKRVRGIVYATDRVKAEDAPKTYEALATPEWKGRVCIRSSDNVYNQSLIGSFIAHKGAEAAKEWAAGIVANMAREPQGGDTDQIKAVAAGECDVAVVNHYYYMRLVTSSDPADNAVVDKVHFIAPNQDDRGAHANLSGAGVLVHAPNKGEAVKLIEFLSTAEAQAAFANANNEFPANTKAPPNEALALIGEFKEDKLSAAEFGRNNPAALMIADEVGWK